MSADADFVVGYSKNRSFSMLGYASTFSGHGFIGSDLRSYDSIASIEPFNRSNPRHAEFIQFADYAIARALRRAQ